MKKHKVFIETTGKAGNRYRLVQRDNTDLPDFLDETFSYWDGHEWQADGKKSMLFYSFQEAAADLRAIQLLDNVEKPKKTYTATIEIEVAGGNPSIKELQDHLGKVAKLSLMEPPPFDGCVQLEIDWGTLQKVKGRVS
jgi:hypothetical protein